MNSNPNYRSIPAAQKPSKAHHERDFEKKMAKDPAAKETLWLNSYYPYHLTNSATTGFLRDMLDRNFGLYIVIGATASGKTTTLNNYIRCSQIDRRGSVITENAQEYTSKSIQIESIEDAVARRSPYIVIDECRDVELLQDALMISTLSNVAITLHCNSIADLVERFKTDTSLKFGSRNMLEKVKGITFASRSSLGLVQESIALNPETRKTLIEASRIELPQLIAREINGQGRATIAQQLDSLRD